MSVHIPYNMYLSTSVFVDYVLSDNNNILSAGLGMKMLAYMEKFIHTACPFLAGCILLGSIYWTAVTCGVVTVLQVSSAVLCVRFLLSFHDAILAR